MDGLCVSEKAAGEWMGVGSRTIRRLLDEGDLVRVRIRKRSYVLRSSIEDLIRRRCGEAKTAPAARQGAE